MNYADDTPEGIKQHQEYEAKHHRFTLELRALVEPSGWMPVIPVVKCHVDHASLLPLIKTLLEAFPTYTHDEVEKLEELEMLDFSLRILGQKAENIDDFSAVFGLIVSLQEGAPPEVARNADHVLEYMEYFVKAKQTNTAKHAAGDVPPDDVRRYLDLENQMH